MSHDHERLLRADAETASDVQATWLAWSRSNDLISGRARNQRPMMAQNDFDRDDDNRSLTYQDSTRGEDITEHAQSSMHGIPWDDYHLRRQVNEHYALKDLPPPEPLSIRSAAVEREAQASDTDPCVLPYRGDFDNSTDDDFEPVGELPTLPKLDFKPFILEIRTLAAIAVFYAGLVVGLVILYRYQYSGRIFHVRSTVSRFTIRTLPSLIGTLSTLIFQSMLENYARILPYIIMAAPVDSRDRCEKARKTLLTFYFPLYNIFDALSNRHWFLFVATVANNFFAIFVIPSKSTLIRKKPSPEDPDLWEVTISTGAAGYLLFTYTFMFGLTVTMLVRLYKRRTGLKWDPVSIADLIMLLQGSDLLDDFSGLEYVFSSPGQRRFFKGRQFRSLNSNQYRLGYWRHCRTNQYWHGIRRWPAHSSSIDRQDYTKFQTTGTNGATDSIQVEHDSQRRRTSETQAASPSRNDEFVESPTYSQQATHRHKFDTFNGFPSITDQSPKALAWWRTRCKEVLDDPSKCYRAVYFWITDYLATAVYVVVAISVAAGVWIIYTDRLTTGLSFPKTEWTTAYFVITFVFTCWFLLLGNFWYEIDIWYRQLQVYMSLRQPTEAKQNLLLSYPCDLPGIVTLKALAMCHWRLALNTATPLIQRLIEVLAGSLLTIDETSYPDQFRIVIDPRLFKVIFSLLCGYIILIPIVWPGLNRRLPITPRCIADSIALFYDSTLVRNQIFLPRRMDEKRWHMEYRLCLAERKYAFGIYPGRYGALHIGIDDAYGYDEDEKALRFVAPLNPPTRTYRRWLKGLFNWTIEKLSGKNKSALHEDEAEALRRLHAEVSVPQVTTSTNVDRRTV